MKVLQCYYGIIVLKCFIVLLQCCHCYSGVLFKIIMIRRGMLWLIPSPDPQNGPFIWYMSTPSPLQQVILPKFWLKMYLTHEIIAIDYYILLTLFCRSNIRILSWSVDFVKLLQCDQLQRRCCTLLEVWDVQKLSRHVIVQCCYRVELLPLL